MKTSPLATNPLRIAVVVPCYRVSRQILSVLQRIGPEVDDIYIVDDACPEESGAVVTQNCRDQRVQVLSHTENQGVGGALVTGYRRALEDGADIVVKLDGDGQMDPDLIPTLINPIVDGIADYCKGNRFFELDGLGAMPRSRLFGNIVLSFLTKLSSGYYQIFDPNNGFTAVQTRVLSRIRLELIHRRYFFESDMLFHLGKLRAVVNDVPMTALYGAEQSSLSVGRSLFTFAAGHLRNTFKRIFYSYFLRDLNPASLSLLFGTVFTLFGVIYGGVHWFGSYQTNTFASSGTVMLAGLTFLLGVQLVMSFFLYDAQNAPTEPLHRRLPPISRLPMPLSDLASYDQQRVAASR